MVQQAALITTLTKQHMGQQAALITTLTKETNGATSSFHHDTNQNNTWSSKQLSSRY
jgi:hypothetical protein